MPHTLSPDSFFCLIKHTFGIFLHLYFWVTEGISQIVEALFFARVGYFTGQGHKWSFNWCACTLLMWHEIPCTRTHRRSNARLMFVFPVDRSSPCDLTSTGAKVECCITRPIEKNGFACLNITYSNLICTIQKHDVLAFRPRLPYDQNDDCFLAVCIGPIHFFFFVCKIERQWAKSNS